MPVLFLVIILDGEEERVDIIDGAGAELSGISVQFREILEDGGA